MKKIILMRHAKSDWGDTNLTDFDRPLNKRGIKAAKKVGEFLNKKDIVPDLIISSPAVRARTTAELFVEENGYLGDIKFVEKLYSGYEEDFINEIVNAPQSVNTLMIIAHNPTIENVATTLALENQYLMFKTATVVVFTAYIKRWSDIKNASCDIEFQFNPKDL